MRLASANLFQIDERLKKTDFMEAFLKLGFILKRIWDKNEIEIDDENIVAVLLLAEKV